MGLGRFVTRLFGQKEEPRAPLPQAEERDYSLSELAGYDGSDPTKPLLIGIRGSVYDVTRGRTFYGPGGPYGMFAGKDCGLERDELDKLEEWIEMFEGKYRNVGRLLEP
ncbi:MAG: cytochrome b5 domain-containing protein [Deltaproteobacteria bacterium]|nr:cytochrome b5 domain-containing protein [Deltaproteobacteria bacterium]